MGKVENIIAQENSQLQLAQPAILKAGHRVVDFDCGEEVLNVWLKKRALAAIGDRTANTFVVCRRKSVVGYYSLAIASIEHDLCNADLRRNAPDPAPAMLLARLAVDQSGQGNKIGQHLVRDATIRVLRAAKHVAARTLMVDAINDRVVAFYRKLGFKELKSFSEKREMTRMHLKLETIAASILEAKLIK